MTEKAVTVCMITHAFYPEYSGAATQCYYLSRNLVKKNCRIMVLTFTNNDSLPSREWIEGIDVRRIFVNKKGFTGHSTAFKLLCFLIKESKHFDIIHFHGFINHLLWIAWINLFLQKKIILKMSLMNYDTPKAVMAKGIFHGFAYRQLNTIVGTTSAMMEKLEEYPFLMKNGYLIPNGVDTNKFMPADKYEKTNLRAKLGLPKTGKIIIFSGAIINRKGIDILLKAWEMLYRDNSSCPSLLIAGPFEGDIRGKTPENEQTRETVLEISRKYSGHIFLCGMKQNIEDYYRASDLFVLPSRNEGLPNALLEAMSCGLRCVVMDFPGVHDVIKSNGKTGAIFKRDNKDALYEVLLNVLHNGDSTYPAGQKEIEEFSIDKIGDTYLQCYQDMM